MVPALWTLEIANALAVGERRHRLTASAIAQFLDLLENLPIETDPQTSSRAFDSTLPLARTHNLSTYDASYLELAMRENLVLATLDDKLKIAAKASGVGTFA